MTDIMKTSNKAGVIALIILAAFAAIGAMRRREKVSIPQTEQIIHVAVRLDLWDPASGKNGLLHDSMLQLTGNGINGYQFYVPGELSKVNSEGKDIAFLGFTLRPVFFFYREGSSRGSYYDSLQDNNPRSLPVDSFLNTRFHFESSMFWNEGNQLVSTEPIPGGTFIEKYIPVVKADASYPDSLFLYFDPALNDLRYSFHPGLDSLRHAKMYRARFIFKPADTIPHREYDFRFQRADALQQKDIQRMKERFMKEKSE